MSYFAFSTLLTADKAHVLDLRSQNCQAEILNAVSFQVKNPLHSMLIKNARRLSVFMNYSDHALKID